VRLPGKGEKGEKGEAVTTVDQPDLFVLCDGSFMDAKGVNGPPNLVVEIISPGSKKYDRKVKFGACQDGGVPEYWINQPRDKTV